MIDLKDVTFIIPIKLDSEDRVNNYKMVIEYLTSLFDTNIIVCESDVTSHREVLDIHKDVKYLFVENNEDYFHRTKLLNIMTKMATTNIICNYDVDVVFPKQQYILAIKKIKKGHAMCFPYGGPFMNVPKDLFNHVVNKEFHKIQEDDMELCHPNSLGGAFFFNKDIYMSIGLENENFKSWGYEDNERVMRMRKFGHSVERIGGFLYHLDHERNVDSVPENPYYKSNIAEFNKVSMMSPEQLATYVNSWHWFDYQKDVV